MPKGNDMHPNSLANLRPSWDKESANAAREKGLEVRRANKEAREKMKMTVAEWKKWKEDVVEGNEFGALDLLRIQMLKFFEEGDVDSAVDIAKTLAEFEQPKLARVDQTNTELSHEDLSDEDLDERIRKLLSEDADADADVG